MANSCADAALQWSKAAVPALSSKLSEAVVAALPVDLKAELCRFFAAALRSSFEDAVCSHEIGQVDLLASPSRSQPVAAPAACCADLTAVTFGEGIAALQPQHEVNANMEPSTSAPAASGSVGGHGKGVRHEPTVELWPSEVNAYLGYKGGFLTRTEALARVWRRTNDANFTAAREQWLARGRVPRKQSVKRDGAADGASGGSDSLARQLECLRDPYPKVLTPEDVDRFRAAHSPEDVSRLYRSKGRTMEPYIVSLFEDKVKQPVLLRNTALYWSDAMEGAGVIGAKSCARPPGPILDPGEFVLKGEVDGAIMDGPKQYAPVECKLRLKAPTTGVPTSELLQIQAYLAALNAERGFHVQHVLGTHEVLHHTVWRNRSLWTNTVMPALRKFVCDVRRLLRGDLTDEALRHEVLYAAEKSPPDDLLRLDDPHDTPQAAVGSAVPQSQSHAAPAAVGIAPQPRRNAFLNKRSRRRICVSSDDETELSSDSLSSDDDWDDGASSTDSEPGVKASLRLKRKVRATPPSRGAAKRAKSRPRVAKKKASSRSVRSSGARSAPTPVTVSPYNLRRRRS